MDQEAFVDALKAAVLDGLAGDVASTWQSPPGRLKSEVISRRADWPNRMSPSERELLESFGAEVARSAVFGVLAVLDGNRTTEAPDGGHLELHHIADGHAELLASSAAEMPVLPLHELLP